MTRHSKVFVPVEDANDRSFSFFDNSGLVYVEEKENVYVLTEQELIALLMQFEMRGRPSMVIINEERAKNLAINFLQSKTNPQTNE